MAQKILVVDDEVRYRSLLTSYLKQDGYEVCSAENGRVALFVAREEKPDLILLDMMMPEMDGITFLREHRKESNTPIIFLTARSDEMDRIVGLELGADDYIAKPFSPREVVARVRAVLRRSADVSPVSTQAHLLKSGELELDLNSYWLSKNRVRIELTRSEFDILELFMQSPNQVFSRLQLLERVQGTAYEGYERTIDTHVKNLRAKIEVNPRKPQYIETVYGVGYRFREVV